jgi:hypothetical protein
MKFVLLSFQGMVFCNHFIKNIIQMSANSHLANHFGVDYPTASTISYHFQKTIGHATKIIDDSVETLNVGKKVDKRFDSLWGDIIPEN